MTVTLVVADDQTVVREGLRSLLDLFDSVEVLGTADTAEAALELVSDLDPDVLLTDLRMPGMGGIEGIRALVERGSRTRAVALTTYDDDTTIVAALQAGAVGFLNKDADPEAIEAALESAAAGRSLLDATAMRALLGRKPAPADVSADPPDGLTSREIEVIALVAEGLSNQQLARQLVVSMSTVKTHINHVLAKTACRDRAALVSYAYRHHLT